MKGFNDIEGTEICEGDEILVTENTYGTTTAGIAKRKVTGFKGRRMYFTNRNHGGISHIIDYGTKNRVLILKGEFKTYTKKELKV